MPETITNCGENTPNSEKEKDLHRKNSAQSWATASSSEISGIPSRFRLIDPNRPTLESIVNKLSKGRAEAKLFKTAAHSVLRTKNREWVLQQTDDAVEEDMSLDDLSKQFKIIHEIKLEGADIDHARQVRILERKESSLSMVSTTSVDSDWSDEEREKLEKLFGAMSARGEKCAKMRHKRKYIQSSLRKGRSEGGDSIDAPSSSTFSWDGAKIVYSRESSLSELTPSVMSSSLEIDCLSRNISLK